MACHRASSPTSPGQPAHSCTPWGRATTHRQTETVRQTEATTHCSPLLCVSTTREAGDGYDALRLLLSPSTGVSQGRGVRATLRLTSVPARQERQSAATTGEHSGGLLSRPLFDHTSPSPHMDAPSVRGVRHAWWREAAVRLTWLRRASDYPTLMLAG
ncbi:hypothetical protein E2C01_064310 [Portunus trituberculatus]|uniref:Uncharacterized protein n=1 Tax=Portunus trituberculatus TaxID=210409 RepID=A0A5B7HIQ3_PORTR|nr:hypothetical protein [Portunus trituberculatus]